MSRWFCFGKKGFCDSIDKCRFCKFADGTGCVNGELDHSILYGIFGEDYDIDRLKEQKMQTNADKIRSMTDEALGKWICSIMSSDCCRWTCPARNMCGLNDNGLVKWLKQSARED